jgi:hypothetical protein
MKPPVLHRLRLGGRELAFRVRVARSARRIRVRIGPPGIEVIRPAGRTLAEVGHFLRDHQAWVLAQLRRVESLPSVRRAAAGQTPALFFHGLRTPVRVAPAPGRHRHRVEQGGEGIVLHSAPKATSTPAEALERWLRRRARADVLAVLRDASLPTRRSPRLYIMNQRTKWGNCSRHGNLSFSWRLVMAPPFVLRYVVLHEVLHLTIPNHSPEFWLALRGRCPETEQARRWLSEEGAYLPTSLHAVLSPARR